MDSNPSCVCVTIGIILNLVSGTGRDSPVGCTWLLALTCGSHPGPRRDSPVGCTWLLALTCGSHPGPRRDSPVGCTWLLALTCGSHPGPHRDSPVGCTWLLALTCGSHPGPRRDSPVGCTWFLALTCGSHPGPRRDSPVGCTWFLAGSERSRWSWWSGRTHYKTHIQIILQNLPHWATALYGQPSFTAKFFVQLITAFLPERFTSRGLFTPSECENILKNQQLTSKIFFHRHRRFPPPPEMATAADGTHPTGMHSCRLCVCFRSV